MVNDVVIQLVIFQNVSCVEFGWRPLCKNISSAANWCILPLFFPKCFYLSRELDFYGNLLMHNKHHVYWFDDMISLCGGIVVFPCPTVNSRVQVEGSEWIWNQVMWSLALAKQITLHVWANPLPFWASISLL